MNKWVKILASPIDHYAPVNYMPHYPLYGERWGNMGGGGGGDLLNLTSKTRPRCGAIDTPLVSTEPSIWHAF